MPFTAMPQRASLSTVMPPLPAVLATCTLPAVLVLDFGGGLLQGAASLGLMVSYLLQVLDMPAQCFVNLWATIIIEAIGQSAGAFLTFGLGARSIGLSILVAIEMLLIGAGITLQLDGLPWDNPKLALFLERALFNLLPLPSAAICTWGAGVIWGADSMPEALLCFLGAMYWVLGRECAASFGVVEPTAASRAVEHGGKAQCHERDNDEDGMCSARNGTRPYRRPGAGDGAAAVCLPTCIVILPSLCHLALHSPSLATHMIEHACVVSRFVSAGLLLLALPSTEWVRHWALSCPLRAVRPCVVGAALLSLSLTAHATITTHSKRGPPLTGQTRWLLGHPPGLSGQVLLAVAFSSLALLATLHTVDAHAPFLPPPLVALLGSMVFGAMTLVVGLCDTGQAAALIGALAAILGLRSRSGLTAMLCGGAPMYVLHGILQRTTGFIAFTYDSALTVSVHTVCTALVGMCGLSAAAIALTFLCRAPMVRCACLLTHGILLGLVETALINETTEAGTVYPTQLFTLSLLGGLFLCERLAPASPRSALAGGLVPAFPPTLWWLLLSVHAGRAALILQSTVGTYADGVLLVAAVTQGLQRRVARQQRCLTSPAVSVFGAFFDANGAAAAAAGLFEIAWRIGLLTFAGYRAHAFLIPQLLRPFCNACPSPPLVLGVVIMLVGISGYLLVATWTDALGSSGAATPSSVGLRACVWLIMAGGLLALLQPVIKPFLIVESVLWTLFHPTASFTFGGTPRLLLWPPWLLYALALVLLAAALRLFPLTHFSAAARLGGCALIGAAACLTVFGMILPLERTLFLLAALAAALASTFLGAITWPHSLVCSSSAMPATVLSVFFALGPIGLTAQHHAFQHSGAAWSVLSSYNGAWLALYAGVASIGAVLTKMHAIAASGSLSTSSAIAGGCVPPGVSMMSPVSLRMQGNKQQQAVRRAGIEWLGGVGNACTLASFTLLVAINMHVLDGTSRGALPLVPLLLLLHPYSLPCRSLNASNRHAPVASAAAAVLTGGAALEELSRLLQEQPLPVVARGLALASCPLPSLIICCKFLWDWKQQSRLLIWCALPLNLMPLLLSHAQRFSDLGAAGCLASGTHILFERHMWKERLSYV